jgi:hypothetical protein
MGRPHYKLITPSEGSSPSTSTDATTQTTCDKKLDAARQLLLTANALLRAESWLRDCLTSFGDNRTSRTEVTKKSREMKKYLLPMMTQAAESMKKAGTILAPIPRVEYIQKRHSAKRKWEAIEATRNSITNNMSEDMQIVAAYTEECKRSIGSTVTPPQKTQRASTRLSSTQSSNDAKCEQCQYN